MPASIDSILLPGLITLKFLGCAGTRADETHFSADHIQQLRQFIQSRRSKNVSAANNAGIAGGIQFRHRVVGLHKELQVTFVAYWAMR